MIDKKTKTYKLLVEKLYDKCQRIQVENERCVMRINSVKKLTRHRSRDVELLKRHLDKHQDNWRTLPMVAPHPKRKIEQKRGPKPKNKQSLSIEQENVTISKEKKVRKQRIKKYTPNNQASQHQLLISQTQEIVPQIQQSFPKQRQLVQNEQIMLLPQHGKLP